MVRAAPEADYGSYALRAAGGAAASCQADAASESGAGTHPGDPQHALHRGEEQVEEAYSHQPVHRGAQPGPGQGGEAVRKENIWTTSVSCCLSSDCSRWWSLSSGHQSLQSMILGTIKLCNYNNNYVYNNNNKLPDDGLMDGTSKYELRGICSV